MIDQTLVAAVLAEAARGRTAKQISAAQALSPSTTYRILNGIHSSGASPGHRSKRRRLAGADTAQLLAAAREVLSSSTTVTDNGCWLTSACDRDGLVHLGGRHFRLARLSYLAFVGPLSTGTRVRRLCDSTGRPGGSGERAEEGYHLRCWRPDHLGVQRPLLDRDGRQDRLPAGRGTTRVDVQTCPHGHEYTLANIRFRATRAGRVTRACRTCARQRRRRELQRLSARPDSGA